MITITFILLAFLATMLLAMPPINVVANVRGKKYDVTAESVSEFSTEIETLTGIEASQQNVLYKGKLLAPTDKFEDLGIAPGEVLSVVRGRRVTPKPAEAVAPSATTSVPSSSGSAGLGGGNPFGASDAAGLEEALKNADPEQLKKAMAQMDNLLDSNFMDEFFDNEEKMEASRQQLLQNLDQYEKAMPGFRQQAEEIASDPVKWKEAMQRTKQQMLKLKEQRDAFRAALAKKESSNIPPSASPSSTTINPANTE
jgi:hypothetical protein